MNLLYVRNNDHVLFLKINYDMILMITIPLTKKYKLYMIRKFLSVF